MSSSQPGPVMVVFAGRRFRRKGIDIDIECRAIVRRTLDLQFPTIGLDGGGAGRIERKTLLAHHELLFRRIEGHGWSDVKRSAFLGSSTRKASIVAPPEFAP